MKRILSLALLLGSLISLHASGPSHLLPPPADPLAKVRAATPGPGGQSGDDVQVQIGDARMVPRLIRRSKGSYETVYDPKIVIPLWTKPRYQTLITLPKGEKILEALAADDDVWEIMKTKRSNLVWVKPKYENSSTSVTVLTAAGTRYLFEASSGSFTKGHETMELLDVMPPAWLRDRLAEANGEKPARRQAGGDLLIPGDQADGTGADGIPPQVVEKEKMAAFQAGQKSGYNAAMVHRDDEMREYAASIFLNANMDYKWSKGNPKLRVKRVFDDGRVTYILFDSATKTQPAFWEVVDGKPKDVTVQTAVFNPNLLIISKLVKEGTLSIDKDEIKIYNKGWSFKAPDNSNQVQMRGEGQPIAGGAQ